MSNSLKITTERHKSLIRNFTELKQNAPCVPDDDPNFLSKTGAPVNLAANQIPALKMPQWVSHNIKFPIIVKHIYNPFKFWFNLHLDEISTEVHDLLADMNHFYNSPDVDDKYSVSWYKGLQQNNAYAARISDVWHRVEVIKISDDAKTCRVFLLDTGSVDLVGVEDMRLLKSCYIKCPRQALRGRLALVTPPKSDAIWKISNQQDATTVMSKLCIDKLLHGFLYAFEETKKIFHFIIVDPNGLNINKELEIRGVAKMVSEERERFPYHDDIFPTFFMLESGQCPNYLHVAVGNQVKIYSKYFMAYQDQIKTEKPRVIFGNQPPKTLKKCDPPTFDESASAPPSYSETMELKMPEKRDPVEVIETKPDTDKNPLKNVPRTVTGKKPHPLFAKLAVQQIENTKLKGDTLTDSEIPDTCSVISVKTLPDERRVETKVNPLIAKLKLHQTKSTLTSVGGSKSVCGEPSTTIIGNDISTTVSDRKELVSKKESQEVKDRLNPGLTKSRLYQALMKAGNMSK